MFYKNKIDKVFKAAKENNEKRWGNTHEDFLRELDEERSKGKIELEKGDNLAIFIAAFKVFSPIFLVLILIVILVLII